MRGAGLEAALSRRAPAGTLRGRMGGRRGDQLLIPPSCFLKDLKGRCLETSRPQRGPCPDAVGKPGDDSSPSYRPLLPSDMGNFAGLWGLLVCKKWFEVGGYLDWRFFGCLGEVVRFSGALSLCQGEEWFSEVHQS